jgi:predicted DsbA family dithiol-disulfide isomerase
VQVGIWSDIACPWCYIGKRRFEAAMGSFVHSDQIEIVWRSFELDPQAPPEREGELAAHLARKYGMPVEQARQAQRQMTATLRELAAELELPDDEVETLLAGDRFAAEVRADEQAAASLGISGVPTFIVERRVAVTGAQPPELLLEMLRRGWAERTPAGVSG